MHRYYFVALRIPDDFSEDGDSEQNGNIDEESEHITISSGIGVSRKQRPSNATFTPHKAGSAKRMYAENDLPPRADAPARKTEKKGSEAKAQAITALLRKARNARTEPTSNQLHVCSPRPRSMSTHSWHTDTRLPMRLGVTVTCPLLDRDETYI